MAMTPYERRKKAADAIRSRVTRHSQSSSNIKSRTKAALSGGPANKQSLKKGTGLVKDLLIPGRALEKAIGEGKIYTSEGNRIKNMKFYKKKMKEKQEKKKKAPSRPSLGTTFKRGLERTRPGRDQMRKTISNIVRGLRKGITGKPLSPTQKRQMESYEKNKRKR